jgi:lipoprotein-anchoring transpeptidase ErfK/SrfK
MSRATIRVVACAVVAVATILASTPATAGIGQTLPSTATVEGRALLSPAAAVPGLRPLIAPVVRSHSAPAAASVAAAPGRQTIPRHLLVEIPRDMPITARPGGGTVVGRMPDGSRFYDVPVVAWVMEVSPGGRFGRVPVPYGDRDATGWIDLRGLDRSTTRVTVRADLSDHRIVVERAGQVVARIVAATGAPGSPTPPGRYFVTDRIPFQAGSVLGSFAFGISGIQPNLPAGWNGGDQLAIHGTNAPGTIGTSASAGCLRVSEAALARLKPLLRPGTPVIITP